MEWIQVLQQPVQQTSKSSEIINHTFQLNLWIDTLIHFIHGACVCVVSVCDDPVCVSLFSPLSITLCVVGSSWRDSHHRSLRFFIRFLRVASFTVEGRFV